MRVVVLVIARKGVNERWDLERLVWLKRAVTAPPWVTIKLIEGTDDNQDEDNNDAVLRVDTADSFEPGIYQKTTLGIENVLKSYPDTTHFVRTNLSTHIIWSRLRDYLRWDPQYSGPWETGQSWARGWGIVMSRAVAEVLVRTGGPGSPEYSAAVPDDVQIGCVLAKSNIRCEFTRCVAPRTGLIWNSGVSIPDNVRTTQLNSESIFVRLRGAPLDQRWDILKALDHCSWSEWQPLVSMSGFLTVRHLQLYALQNITSQQPI